MKLDERMKLYEKERSYRMTPFLPVLARIDGRSFSKFTRGMDRPFDFNMSLCMRETMQKLAEETNALLGYTQSDEITLLWYSDDIKSQIWFDGKHSKMVSQAAALATLYFNKYCSIYLPEYASKLPTFDARVWSVPNKEEAANVFVWREEDATRNSLSMAASHYYSHKELQNKNSRDMHDLLMKKGVNWNDYPHYFKRGSFVQRRIVNKPYGKCEIGSLPEHHNARKNPELSFERSEWKLLDGRESPPLKSIWNLVDFCFKGALPMKRGGFRDTAGKWKYYDSPNVGGCKFCHRLIFCCQCDKN
jgi:tRNA(His) 5'-end guanylyltransferase